MEKQVSFTYPEGFIEAANSLESVLDLPDEESRKKFLEGLVRAYFMW